MAEQKELHEAAATGMQADAVAGSGMRRDAGAGASDDKSAITDAAFEPADHVPGRRPFENIALSEPGMVDFLKDQIRVKDEQIRVKDQQIAAMLERDRETNILIRGLQDRIGDAFGLLVSGKPREEDRPRYEEHRSDRHDIYRTVPSQDGDSSRFGV